MLTSIEITSADAAEAMLWIAVALKEGAKGFDLDALLRVSEALGEADRIEISSEGDAQ